MDGSTALCFLKEPTEGPVVPKSETKAERRAEQELFYKNVYFFWRNRKYILNDGRMLFAPVVVDNGLAYINAGGLRYPTLGAYVEFWMNCPEATITDDEGKKGLVCRMCGSPLTGVNCCDVVFEDGVRYGMNIPCFNTVWQRFIKINRRYKEAKETLEIYSLQKVINVMKSLFWLS